MGMTFAGSFYRNLDEKGRIAIPKVFRDAISCQTLGGLYLAPGYDRSLNLFSDVFLKALGEEFARRSPVEQSARAFGRLLYAQLQSLELDRQGRVRIDENLRNWAQLDSNVVVLGVRDHIEIWDQNNWESYLEEQRPQFDRLAEKTMGDLTLPSVKSDTVFHESHDGVVADSEQLPSFPR